MSIVTSPPLSEFPVVTEADPDELATFAKSAYRPQSVRPLTGGWSNRIHHVQLGEIGLSYGRLECGLDPNVGKQETFYKVVIGLSGASVLRQRHEEMALRPGEGVVKSATLPIKWRHGAEAEALYLVIGRAALERELTALTGRSLPGPIEFATRIRAPALIRLVWFVASEVNANPVLVEQPVMPSAYAELAMRTLLTQQAHNYPHWLAARPSDLAPQQLRLAEEILETHAEEPLTMAQVARAAGYSIRSMNRAFRRYRGRTPYAFLQGVRLERANRMLSLPGRARSVTEAALSCGFGNPGRFSVLYRERFGETPSTTFRRCTRPDTPPQERKTSARPCLTR